jgi:hypothetical protein
MKKILFLAIVTFAACSNNKQLEQAQNLYQEAMEIHDAVMPRMDEMYKLRQELTLKLDSISTDTVANIGRIAEYKKVLSDLAVAEKGMMDWMHNIQDVPGSSGAGVQTKEIPIDEVIKIQQAQKNAVEQARKKMEASIAEGKNLIDLKNQ